MAEHAQRARLARTEAVTREELGPGEQECQRRHDRSHHKREGNHHAHTVAQDALVALGVRLVDFVRLVQRRRALQQQEKSDDLRASRRRISVKYPQTLPRTASAYDDGAEGCAERE